MLPNVGWFEMMMLMGLAVLIFGKRLPEVGRSLGKGICRVQERVERRPWKNSIFPGTGRSSSSSSTSWRSSEPTASETVYTEASVPKFELPGAASTPPVSTPETEYQPSSSRD